MDRAEEWARKEFGNIEWGDKRLAQRAIGMAGAMAKRPGVSLPKQMRGWAPQKAAYRFLSHEAVSYEKISRPHWEKTREQARHCGKVVLMVQDITELDYTTHRETEGLGPIGNHGGAGLMLHNTLAVGAEAHRVLGLAYQQVWVRENVSHKQTESKSLRRKREDRQSTRWGKAVAEIGTPPAGVRWVYVADREADIYAFFEQTQASRADFCVRIVQDRRLVDPTGEESQYLLETLRSLPAQGIHPVDVPTSVGHPQRTARMAIAWQAVEIHAPHLDHRPEESFRAWALRTWEVDPPPGVQALEWLLLTSVPVQDLSDALERLDWYTCRWIVEEYHSCLKTGCSIQKSQLRQGKRLERWLGFLAVLAVRLLQLRDLARTNPDQPALESVEPVLVQIMALQQHQEIKTMTIREFWHAVAGIGGFPGRHSDGEPGWKRLWDGWLHLLDWAEGVQMAAHLPGLEDVGNP